MTQRSFAIPLGNLGLFRFDLWHVSLFLGHKMRLGGASPLSSVNDLVSLSSCGHIGGRRCDENS